MNDTPDKKQPTRGPWLRRGSRAIVGPDDSGPGGRGRRSVCMMVEADDPQSQADMALILCAADLLAAHVAQAAYFGHYDACPDCRRTGGCLEGVRLLHEARKQHDNLNDLLRVEGLL